MNLQKVTLTGADDSVKIPQLIELQEEFPFVEWGILVSVRCYPEGTPRFPSAYWLAQLNGWQKVSRTPLKLSAHICGKWIQDICSGKWTILENESIPLRDFVSSVGRIQLNFGQRRHEALCKSWVKRDEFLSGFEHPRLKGRQIIFGQLEDGNSTILEAAREAGIDAVSFI